MLRLTLDLLPLTLRLHCVGRAVQLVLRQVPRQLLALWAGRLAAAVLEVLSWRSCAESVAGNLTRALGMLDATLLDLSEVGLIIFLCALPVLLGSESDLLAQLSRICPLQCTAPVIKQQSPHCWSTSTCPQTYALPTIVLTAEKCSKLLGRPGCGPAAGLDL